MAADVTEQQQTAAALATRLKQQAVVTQLSQTALCGSGLDALFDQATRLMADSLNVEYAKLLQLTPHDQSLWLRSGVGWQPGFVGQARVSAKLDSQAGYTLVCGQPVIVQDLQTETRFRGSPLLTEHGVVSGMSTVVQGRGEHPFGVLGAHSMQRRTFTQDDVNFLQAIANLLAAAINRKQTEHELQQLNSNLEQRIHERTQALEDVNQELEAFSYSVAHDLRAPLRAIQGFAQVLIEDYQPALDEPGKEYIHRMAAAAERLDILVRDLLDYSRLGRTAIHRRPVSLTKVIGDIVGELESVMAAKQALVDVAPNLPVVYAQRSVLKQVLVNLIDNGLKFCAPGSSPQIQIWAEQVELSPEIESEVAQSWTRLWIEDCGIGIAPHHQERIFGAFERLHGVEAYSGTGIGLAIVKRGIERLGGRIGVESKINQGSRFWIELPIAGAQH